MKRILFALLTSVLLFTASAFAADSMTVVSTNYYTNEGSKLKTVTLRCTTDTDGSFSEQLSSAAFDFIAGWEIVAVRVANATTQTDPTANSDMTFTLTAAGALDLLGGAGADAVDNDVVNQVRPSDGTNAHVIYVIDQFFIEIANNAVSTAIVDVTLILVPSSE